ncbi:hypothetical protein DFH08DRAFT_937003 [Mycena albidolilacea]|uniref:Uncharacterized protein n=1 Tax=Mycena albidolilacea TaxID=1033008 RepID=A0AAD7A2P0_9AGAR|nr:hypothetical protein DFH08DRAFT_937003 [Mycena albidolilacea]
MSHTLGPRSSSPTGSKQIYERVILGLVIPGVTLTTALLTLCGYAAWNPVSRRYLDRVSFRLLIYALVANLVFGITFTVSAFMAHPGWTCDLLSFIPNLSLMFSAGMFFCMALNLPLVLAHNVNGQKMEKYYVLGTTLVGLICNVVPYASGKLGWNAINGTCWYRSTDLAEMMRWLISTQTFWIMLSAVGEVGAFLTILGYLIAYELDMRRFHTDTQFKTTYLSETSHCAGSTILKFRNIILRIGLYPLVSCLLNISTSIIDMYQTKNPESSELNWRLNLTDVAIYAGRPLIYGLLAATDPSLIRALRALRHPEDDSETQLHGPRWPTPSACLSTVIEMPPSEVDCDETSREETSTAPTLGTILEEGKEGRLGGGDDQGWVTTSTLAPTQRASIDVRNDDSRLRAENREPRAPRIHVSDFEAGRL